MGAIVSNLKCTPCEGPTRFRVDRKTPLGNPFYLKEEADRDKVCDAYEEWFNNSVLVGGKSIPEGHLNDFLLKAYNYLQEILKVARTEHVVLLCHCGPKRCHADTIARWINRTLAEEKAE